MQVEGETHVAVRRQHTLRIPTGDLQDPVKRDLEKSLRERQLLCPTRLQTPPVAGKHTLSTVLWDKLDSTPCGHHMKPDGSYAIKPLTAQELSLRESDVVFDDYNVVKGRHCLTGQVLHHTHLAYMQETVAISSHSLRLKFVFIIIVIIISIVIMTIIASTVSITQHLCKGSPTNQHVRQPLCSACCISL